MKNNEYEVVICSHCGAKMLKHWHRMSKGLAITLLKFKNVIITKKENKIHIMSEMNLTKSEYNNFQKLRYHGLVAKCKDSEGNHISGFWLLTRRGNLFSMNQIQIPFRVQTYRNKISERETKLVGIGDILRDLTSPYWETIKTIQSEIYFPDINEIDDFKIDENGQLSIF